MIETGSIPDVAYSAFEPKWGIGGSLEIRQGLGQYWVPSRAAGPPLQLAIWQAVLPKPAPMATRLPALIRGQAKIDFSSRPRCWHSH